MRILVLGASGMLGNAMLRYLHANGEDVRGTVRSQRAAQSLPDETRPLLIDGVDVAQQDSLVAGLAKAKPDVVINCIGIVKQLASAENPLVAVPVNTLLPHRLAQLCALAGARLIHISTDCVFSGNKGMYTEDDIPDAQDLYGRSKLLGEVDCPHAITLRTSIIGRELNGSRSLVDWFLSQTDAVMGYRRAIYSGLPTVELARVICEFVLPRPELHGLYHVSSDPISKLDLLGVLAKTYERSIQITPDDELVIDRSLDSTRFQLATGYVPPAWSELVEQMRRFG